MSDKSKQSQSAPSAQTNPSSNSTAQSTVGRNSSGNGVQQSFPPINSAQVQNPASQQQQQQSSQVNQTSRLPVLANQQPSSNIRIDDEKEDDESKTRDFSNPQPPPSQANPPPPSSSSSERKSGSFKEKKDKSDDSFHIKDSPKYPFGLKVEPKNARPTRGIKIDNLENFLKEKKYQEFLNEIEIVELFADSGITTTVYVLLIAGYVLTKKVFQIQHLIGKYSDNNKLDKPVNDNLLGFLVGLVADQNSMDMLKNIVSIYEKDLPKQKCLSEYVKLFPLICGCMKEVMNKKEVELSEQQEKMRLYLLENKSNKDKIYSTIKECAKNLTDVDPNITK